MGKKVYLIHLFFILILIYIPFLMIPTSFEYGDHGDGIAYYELDDPLLPPTLAGQVFDTYQYNNTLQVLIVNYFRFYYDYSTHEMRVNTSIYTKTPDDHPHDLFVQINQVSLELNDKELQPVLVEIRTQNLTGEYQPVADYDYYYRFDNVFEVSQLEFSFYSTMYDSPSDSANLLKKIAPFVKHIEFVHIDRSRAFLMMLSIFIPLLLGFGVMVRQILKSISLHKINQRELQFRLIYFPIFLTALVCSIVANYDNFTYRSIFINHPDNNVSQVWLMLLWSNTILLFTFVVLPLVYELFHNDYRFFGVSTKIEDDDGANSTGYYVKTNQTSSKMNEKTVKRRKTTSNDHIQDQTRYHAYLNHLNSIVVYQTLVSISLVIYFRYYHGTIGSISIAGIFHCIWVILRSKLFQPMITEK